MSKSMALHQLINGENLRGAESAEKVNRQMLVETAHRYYLWSVFARVIIEDRIPGIIPGVSI